MTRATTDMLRAQTHEFANQLHTISGLIQIGEYDEVVKFVHGVHLSVVGAAHTGASALEAVKTHRPHRGLLDIHLPDINGHDLLQQLRDLDPELDVLVISAAREVDTVRRALRGGIVHYLMKSFSAADLRDQLEHYARRTARWPEPATPPNNPTSTASSVSPATSSRCRRAAAWRPCSGWWNSCPQAPATSRPRRPPAIWEHPVSAPGGTWNTSTKSGG